MQCIGATTLDEYRKHIEKDPALERRFQPVKVPEPSVDETIQILKGLRERYEIHHKLRYTDEALVAAAQLSYQYIRYADFLLLCSPLPVWSPSVSLFCLIYFHFLVKQFINLSPMHVVLLSRFNDFHL